MLWIIPMHLTANAQENICTCLAETGMLVACTGLSQYGMGECRPLRQPSLLPWQTVMDANCFPDILVQASASENIFQVKWAKHSGGTVRTLLACPLPLSRTPHRTP